MGWELRGGGSRGGMSLLLFEEVGKREFSRFSLDRLRGDACFEKIRFVG